jgi:uncharacterized damage-inducible protein DinB
MTVIDDQGRPEPPSNGDEAATLVGFLEFQRATFEWKCAGLDAAGFATRVASSTITLGGMMKHLAYVEEWWFSQWLGGSEASAPWSEVDWDADADWDWHSAALDTPDEIRALWLASVARSRALVATKLSQGDPGQRAMRTSDDGDAPSLRWILCHTIEEYARHNGHADLIREAVDGQTGE